MFILLSFSETRIADDQIQLLNVAGEVSDLKCFLNGWSQHESNLTPDMYAAEQKWQVVESFQQFARPG